MSGSVNCARRVRIESPDVLQRTTARTVLETFVHFRGLGVMNEILADRGLATEVAKLVSVTARAKGTPRRDITRF